jgi:hypothetical protein
LLSLPTGAVGHFPYISHFSQTIVSNLLLCFTTKTPGWGATTIAGVVPK